VLVYGAAFIGTLIWALADAGFDFWPLVSRLMLPTGLMLLALLTWPALRKAETGEPAGRRLRPGRRAGAGMVATFVQMFQPHPTVAIPGHADAAGAGRPRP
jgi:quinate dehydrogenase (quinone)